MAHVIVFFVYHYFIHLFMKPVYAKSSFLDDVIKMVEDEYSAKLSLCTQLNVTCHEELGEYGIWLNIAESHLLIDPLHLFESIFIPSRYLHVSTVVVNGKKEKASFRIEIVKENYVYSWSLYHPGVKNYSRNYYSKDDYIKLVRKLLQDLYDKWNEGNAVAYEKGDVSLNALEICAKQCQLSYTFPTDFRLVAKDIVVEDFVFDVLQAEEYRIGIGDRVYKAYLPDWENNFERIRYQLEGISFYGNDASVSFYCDMEKITVSLIKKRILDEVKQVGGGEAYSYKDYLYVSISANQCEYMPPIFSFCEIKKTISKFYESLLQMALFYPETANYDCYNSRITVYNQIKSPMIESFLTDKKQFEDTYATRQVRIKSILIINPDYDELIYDENNLMLYEDGLGEIINDEFDIQGFFEWGREIHPIVIEASVGNPYEKDWEDYHRRGLEYARELRKCLPDEYDLWYHRPFEDKTNTVPDKQLIIE